MTTFSAAIRALWLLSPGGATPPRHQVTWPRSHLGFSAWLLVNLSNREGGSFPCLEEANILPVEWRWKRWRGLWRESWTRISRTSSAESGTTRTLRWGVWQLLSMIVYVIHWPQGSVTGQFKVQFCGHSGIEDQTFFQGGFSETLMPPKIRPNTSYATGGEVGGALPNRLNLDQRLSIFCRSWLSIICYVEWVWTIDLIRLFMIYVMWCEACLPVITLEDMNTFIPFTLTVLHRDVRTDKSFDIITLLQENFDIHEALKPTGLWQNLTWCTHNYGAWCTHFKFIIHCTELLDI